MRREWIDKEDAISVAKQCILAGVCRSTIYSLQKPVPIDESDLLYCRLIDEEYTRHPFFGSRRMVIFLRVAGHIVNRKRVQRLMRHMGIVGMAPGPNTSRPQAGHKIYPYLLRGVPIIRPDQVWSTDITYIRLTHGFAYLIAIIDWYSRRVLSWQISNSMEAVFCVDCLEEALRHHARPGIFNTDQGSQFTSEAFTSVLKREGITISMDGRGRAFDNIFVERLWRSVKHEDIYLKGYSTMWELMVGMTEYFVFYNGERPHQSLGYKTPNVVHQTAEGGGAIIVDKFARADADVPPVPLRSTGGTSAKEEEQAKAKPEQLCSAVREAEGIA